MAAFQKAAGSDGDVKPGKTKSTSSSPSAVRNRSIATKPAAKTTTAASPKTRGDSSNKSSSANKVAYKAASSPVASPSKKANKMSLGSLFGRSPTRGKRPAASTTMTPNDIISKSGGGGIKMAPGRLKNASTFLPTRQDRQDQSQRPSQGLSEKAQHASVAPKPPENPDWEYLYELAVQYDRYKLQEAGEAKDQASAAAAASPSPSPSTEQPPHTPKDRAGIKAALEGIMGGDSLTADGRFLTDEYIGRHLVQHPKFPQALTFDYRGQARLFKRFDRKDDDQRRICGKFVDALLGHPRSSDITCLDLSNAMLPDKFLEVLATECVTRGGTGLPRLQVLNLESNLLGQGEGVPALARAIAAPDVWRYLQILKLENQKMPLTSTAEEALGPAVLQSPSLAVVSLRVRGGLERQQIENTVAANVDLLRQARRRHAAAEGTLKERKRNETEAYFDAIAANGGGPGGSPAVVGVDLVGCVKFLGLNPAERARAGAAFATNRHVTSVRMVKLQLDDAFCEEFGRALASNDTLEKVVLDSNAISGRGMAALFDGLGKNKSVVELQVRHQSKTTSSADEQALPRLMEPNRTLTKLGIDLRDQNVRRLLENKTNENREYQRKLRAAAARKD